MRFTYPREQHIPDNLARAILNDEELVKHLWNALFGGLLKSNAVSNAQHLLKPILHRIQMEYACETPLYLEVRLNSQDPNDLSLFFGPEVLVGRNTERGIRDGDYYFLDEPSGKRTTGADYWATLFKHAENVRGGTGTSSP